MNEIEKTMKDAINMSIREKRDMQVIYSKSGGCQVYSINAKVAEGYQCVFKTDIESGNHKRFTISSSLF